MEFDWLDVPVDLKAITPKEIEESFEDPFSLRLMPDGVWAHGRQSARYFNLGKSLNDRPLFTVFWTDGKKFRCIAVRDMAPEELSYYDRKNAEAP